MGAVRGASIARKENYSASYAITAADIDDRSAAEDRVRRGGEHVTSVVRSQRTRHGALAHRIPMLPRKFDETS